MAEFVTAARPYLEALYFLAGVVVAGGVLVGMRQLRLLKQDIVSRSDRAAKEKAIEMSFRMADLFAASIRGQNQLGELGYPSIWEGKVGDFTPSSLPDGHLKVAERRYMSGIPLRYLNPMEAVAASFVNGIAEEKLAFPMCGAPFCAFVSVEYDMFCFARQHSDSAPFSNTIKLYRTWSNRLSKEQLEAAKEGLEASLAQIEDREIPPLSPLGKPAV